MSQWERQSEGFLWIPFSVNFTAVSIWFAFVHLAYYCSAKCEMRNLEYLMSLGTASRRFVWRNQICLSADYFAEDPDINSSLLVEKHECCCPLSFRISSFIVRILARTFKAAYVCLHYAGSLCVRFCVWSVLALSSHSLALFLCLCVFSPYEASYDQRGICHPHTHTQTRSQAKHSGTRRRAGTYTIITWEVSMEASTGSPLELLPVLVHCRYYCSSSSFFANCKLCGPNMCRISCCT